MEFAFYNSTQTPFSFLGYQESAGTPQEPQNNGFPSAISSLTQNFDGSFDQFTQNLYEGEGFVPPPLGQHRQSLQSLQQSPTASISPANSIRNRRRKTSSADVKVTSSSDQVYQSSHNNTVNGVSDCVNDDVTNMQTRDSSEERESLTPVQSKRKAQNRAAQRAFRERKERHVKDLEAKLDELESQSMSLQSENDRLKRELARSATENEILRATSSSANRCHQSAKQQEEIMEAGPMKWTPTDFLSAIDRSSSTDSVGSSAHYNSHRAESASPPSSTSSLRPQLEQPKPDHRPTIESQLSPRSGSFLRSAHRIFTSPQTGQRLLSVGATWEYILGHPLYTQGSVDIADVSARLKGKAECDGTGPVFGEDVIHRAIEDAAGLTATAVTVVPEKDAANIDDRSTDVVMTGPEDKEVGS